jgi:hypothetical protein
LICLRHEHRSAADGRRHPRQVGRRPTVTGMTRFYSRAWAVLRPVRFPRQHHRARPHSLLPSS